VSLKPKKGAAAEQPLVDRLYKSYERVRGGWFAVDCMRCGGRTFA